MLTPHLLYKMTLVLYTLPLLHTTILCLNLTSPRQSNTMLHTANTFSVQNFTRLHHYHTKHHRDIIIQYLATQNDTMPSPILYKTRLCRYINICHPRPHRISPSSMLRSGVDDFLCPAKLDRANLICQLYEAIQLALAPADVPRNCTGLQLHPASDFRQGVPRPIVV